jgi:hypothetical protein
MSYPTGRIERDRELTHMDADRAKWSSAKSQADVAELTARWLEGDIGSQPGYAYGAGPDSETTPLIGTLARIDRAGYLTRCSQPGFADEVGADGRRWAHKPAVDGYIHPGPLLDAIRQTAAKSGLVVMCAASEMTTSTSQ